MLSYYKSGPFLPPYVPLPKSMSLPAEMEPEL